MEGGSPRRQSRPNQPRASYGSYQNQHYRGLHENGSDHQHGPHQNINNQHPRPHQPFRRRKKKESEPPIDPEAVNTWKETVLAKTEIVADVDRCKEIVNEMLDQVADHKSDGDIPDGDWYFTKDKLVIAVDCEGINLGLFGKVTLLQVATMQGDVYLFDILKCPEMIKAELEKILSNADIIKIIHDCRNDAVTLFYQFDVRLRTIFDTQQINYFLKGQHISLNNLCKRYGAPVNPMRDIIKNIYKKNQNYWAKRPLTKEMIVYAASDALCLANEKVYSSMWDSVTPEKREHAMKFCLRQHDYEVHVQRKERAIAKFRERLEEAEETVVMGLRNFILITYMDLTEEEKGKIKISDKQIKNLKRTYPEFLSSIEKTLSRKIFN